MIIIEGRDKPKSCKECREYLCWGECAINGLRMPKEALYTQCPIHDTVEGLNAYQIRRACVEYKKQLESENESEVE